MELINLTNPGESPVEGDRIKEIHTAVGTVTKIYHAPTTGAGTPLFYAHVTLTEADGGAIPGIANDGIDSVNVQTTLRYDADPTSQIVPIPDGTYLITIRDQESRVYDKVRVTFTSSACSVDYTTTLPPATVHIATDDIIIPGVDCKVEIVGDTTLDVYRDFSGA